MAKVLSGWKCSALTANMSVPSLQNTTRHRGTGAQGQQVRTQCHPCASLLRSATSHRYRYRYLWHLKAKFLVAGLGPFGFAAIDRMLGSGEVIVDFRDERQLGSPYHMRLEPIANITSHHLPRAALLPISSKYSSATLPSMLPAANPLLQVVGVGRWVEERRRR